MRVEGLGRKIQIQIPSQSQSQSQSQIQIQIQILENSDLSSHVFIIKLVRTEGDF